MSYKRELLCAMLLLVMVVTAACTTANEPAKDEHEAAWAYEGENSPEHWGDLKIEFATCGTGNEQSPIDLTAASSVDLENITFAYQDSEVTILHNGHTIQVNYDEGSHIEIDGQQFELLQFHFHSPSEHVVDGASFSAEMHLVHADAEGNLAVVGVLIAEGEENTAFAPVWDNLPDHATDPTATGVRILATDLLPAEPLVYRYNGSLTTPPCSEGVLWSVMANPIEMSAEQIDMFTNILEGNNRPLQPLNPRELQLDQTP